MIHMRPYKTTELVTTLPANITKLAPEQYFLISPAKQTVMNTIHRAHT